MNILYWNLKANCNLEGLISDCIKENTVDIAVFSEFKNTQWDIILKYLGFDYQLLETLGACEKVRVLYKKNLSVRPLQEQHRYLLASFDFLDKTYLLVGVHLPSNPYSNSDDRKNEIRKIIDDIISNENNPNIYSTIVMGDMNASPFDSEMIGKDAFNSVLFKSLIKQQDTVTYQGCEYKRFYNPIIEYINESTEMYGSYYYNSGYASLYWYCYDQLLIRKDLADSIVYFKYLKAIKGRNLLNKANKPDDTISDHLPLLVDINL